MIEPIDQGLVFNIQRYSTQDGPGLRTTVFLKGCPLSCSWCHNPESQARGQELIFRPERCLGCGDCLEACPTGAADPAADPRPDCLACGKCAEVCPSAARELIGQAMTVAEVMTEIMKDRDFYEESGGGVTFSGGEPLAQPGFLLSLLRACRDEEIPAAVDTSGAASWEAFEAVRPLVDLFLYDLKLMDDGLHKLYVGTSNRPILDNLKRLALAGENILVRCPVIPGVNDGPDHIDVMGRFVARLPGDIPIKLLGYHRTGLNKHHLLGRSGEPFDTDLPGQDLLSGLALNLSRMGLDVTI